MGHQGLIRIDELVMENRYVKKKLAALAVISALVLTGCSQANVAATLGKETISQSEIQKRVDEVLASRKAVDTSGMQLERGEALNRAQLRFVIVTDVMNKIADELAIKITNTELATTKTALIQQGGGEAQIAMNLVGAGIAPSDFDRYIRAVMISNKVNAALVQSGIPQADADTKFSQLISAKAHQLGIVVNPRYGTWDDASTNIVAKDAAGSAVTSSTSK